MLRLIAATLVAGSFFAVAGVASAHPFLGALPYSKADASRAASKEDCKRIEFGKHHRRPPNLRGFVRHEHYYIASRPAGQRCVTVFHDPKRGMSSANIGPNGEFQERPTRLLLKELFSR